MNLDNPNEVRNGIGALLGKVQPFLGLVKPFLGKASPTIKRATGFSAEELYDVVCGLSGNGPQQQDRRPAPLDLRRKYDNL